MRMVKLGDVCKVFNGGTPDTKVKSYWNGENAWVAPAEMGKLVTPFLGETRRYLTDAGLSNSSAQMLPINSVIMSSRAPIGHLIINTVPMATNQGCKGLVPNKDVDFKFLYYFLFANKEYLNSLGSGTTFVEISGTTLKSVEMPLPPLPEQKTIVERLDAAFAEIDQLEANLRKKNTSVKALFESVVDSKLQAIISKSELRKLKTVVDIARGGSPRPIDSYLTQEPSGIPWIKIGDATASGKYITTTAQRITRDGISRSRVVQPGDFILSNSMSFGRPYIMGIEGCIHDGWLVLSDPSQNFQQDYLYFLLGSNYVFQQFNRLAAGSTVRNLNIELAGSVEIPVPTLEVQRKLSEQFQSLEAETTALRLKSQKDREIIASLKQSILSSAFIEESDVA